jgi:hypothetical protein
MEVRVLYSLGPAKGKVAACCENGDEHLGFIKFIEFLAYQLSAVPWRRSLN